MSLTTQVVIGVSLGLVAVVALVLVVGLMAAARFERSVDNMSLIALLSAESAKAAMTGDKARMEYALAGLRNMQRPTVRLPPIRGAAKVGTREPR